MILISAALVLAAIVLLIAGVVLGTPNLVMWSIVVSVLSAVCLLIGALLRRHELFPAGGRPAEGTAPTSPGSAVPQLAHAGAVTGAYGGTLTGAPAHPVATPMVAAPPVTHHGIAHHGTAHHGTAHQGAAPQGVTHPQHFPSPPQGTGPGTRPPAVPGRGLGPDAIVLVIPGRKRFHLATCRQLAGRETEELTHEEAREEGFTPCTTCLPEASARTAEPEDRARDDDLRAEAGPATVTRPGHSEQGHAGQGHAGQGHAEQGLAVQDPSAQSSPASRPSEPTGDETREEPRPAPGQEPGATDEPMGPAGDATPATGSVFTDEAAEGTGGGTEGGTGDDRHTVVDWFGRTAAKPAAPSAPSAPSPESSTPSWPSAASWSPPAAGSTPDRTDDEPDESLTDTAEHDWFRRGRTPPPWDPGRPRTGQGEVADEAPSTRAADEPSDSGAGENASVRPAAETTASAVTEKPVEPAETPESGRAGFEVSAGSTSTPDSTGDATTPSGSPPAGGSTSAGKATGEESSSGNTGA